MQDNGNVDILNAVQKKTKHDLNKYFFTVK